jgi:hypothetical protein
MTPDLTQSRGYVCTISLTGSVLPQFSQCMLAMARYNDSIGLKRVEYEQVHGLFIEAARDQAILHALNPRGDGSEPAYDWVLQIDADATFPQDTLHRLLHRAYIDAPTSGAIGAYSQLKPHPHLPTIDTGTGTWEEHYPGEGLLSVIRTGCHCILIKTGRRLGSARGLPSSPSGRCGRWTTLPAPSSLERIPSAIILNGAR